MIAQVKEWLRENGKLEENIQTVFKVVRVNDKGEYRPALSGNVELRERIVYTPGDYYKVGENFQYPAFAFHDEVCARNFIYMITEGLDIPPLAVMSFVAYQWTWLEKYLFITLIPNKTHMERFWSSTRPFDHTCPMSATNTTPHGTIGLFEFDVGDVIYGG